MSCTVVELPGGGRGFACGPRRAPRRCGCGAPASLLCDWKTPVRKSGTCDAPLCARCASSPAPGKNLCPEHAGAWAQWKAAHQETES